MSGAADQGQLETELARQDAVIAAQEGLVDLLPAAQRAAVMDTLAVLREQRAGLQSRLTVVRDGAVAEGTGATALGAGAIQVQIRGNVYLGPPADDPPRCPGCGGTRAHLDEPAARAVGCLAALALFLFRVRASQRCRECGFYWS